MCKICLPAKEGVFIAGKALRAAAFGLAFEPQKMQNTAATSGLRYYCLSFPMKTPQGSPGDRSRSSQGLSIVITSISRVVHPSNEMLWKALGPTACPACFSSVNSAPAGQQSARAHGRIYRWSRSPRIPSACLRQRKRYWRLPAALFRPDVPPA